MEALHGEDGQVKFWLERDTGNIMDLNGQHVAFVDGDSVYSWQGSHLGWFEDDHVRDSAGAVAYFLPTAKDLGVHQPFLGFEPFQPFKQFAPFRPFLPLKPFKPFRSSSWSRSRPF